MRKIGVVIIFCLLASFSVGIHAQSSPLLMCGDTISDRFATDNLTHRYTIDMNTGTTLVIHSLPIATPIDLSVEILNANGALIGGNEYSPQESPAIIETSEILASGTYQVIVTADTGGDYQLFVSCVSEDGAVISNNNLVHGLTCGDQVDNTMIRPDEIHRYFIYLDDDSVMDVFLESLYGMFGEMTFELGLYSPTNQELDRINEDFKDIERTIFEQTASTEGVYRLYVKGYDSVDENYRLSIDCTLPDGSLALSGDDRQVLEPTELSPTENDAPPPDTSDDDSTNTDDETDNETQPPFANPLELIEGLPNTGQLMGDEAIAAYTFVGDTDETITLAYQHLRGDSSLDIWLQSPDSEMIFTSSMLLAHSLSTQVTLPEAGHYTIYLTLTDRPQEADAVFTIEVLRED